MSNKIFNIYQYRYIIILSLIVPQLCFASIDTTDAVNTFDHGDCQTISNLKSNRVLLVISTPYGINVESIINRIMILDRNIKLIPIMIHESKYVNLQHKTLYEPLTDRAFKRMYQDESIINYKDLLAENCGIAKTKLLSVINNDNDAIITADYTLIDALKSMNLATIVSIYIYPSSISSIALRLKDLYPHVIVSQTIRDLLSNIDHYQKYDYTLAEDVISKNAQDIIDIRNAALLRIKTCTLSRSEMQVISEEGNSYMTKQVNKK